MNEYRALYLHIPFCKQRCNYCDFTTEALLATDPRMDDYLERLIRDLRAASRTGELAHIETIYIGGGTPTHFGHGRLVELAYTLSLSLNLEQVREFTCEANPESYHAALGRDLYALGVSRLSFGVQSFVDAELAALGRIHTARQAREAVLTARERFENVSLDLMCGIPEQSLASWEYSLTSALELEPTHISVYPLEIYEDTPLGQRLSHARGEEGSKAENNAANSAEDNAGRKAEYDAEDNAAACMELAAELLAAVGYERYEVASYAKPGFACAHNQAYWTGVPYLGLGRGAASMKNIDGGGRERWRTDEDSENEYLTPREARLEDLMLGMRLAKGVEEELVVQTASLVPQLLPQLEELQDLGLLKHSNGRYCPTSKLGWIVGNELYARIWELR